MYARRKLGLLAAVVLSASVLATSAPPGAVAVATPEGIAADALQLAEEWNVSTGEAARRLALQDEIGGLGAEAAARWPESFGGLWIDHDHGGRVALAFTEHAATRVAELARDFSEPGRLHAVPVVRPQRDLHALLTQMAADREEARAGRLAFPGVNGADYDLVADARRNTVVVRVNEMTVQTRGAFASRYGEHIVVEPTGTVKLTACTLTGCKSTLRSGLQDSSSGCSLAFTVAVGGARSTLSAGHCSGTTRSHGFTTYGSVVQEQFGGRVDAERHSASLNGFQPGAYVWVSTTETARPITSVGTWATLAVGAGVCKTGVTTGFTCGTVTNTNISVGAIPNSEFFIEATYCSEPGDSGAGVFSGNKALGISSASVAGCFANERSTFGHIEFVQNAFAHFVKTSETAPTLSSVSGARVAGNTITVSFSKPVRCSSVSTFDFTVRINNLLNNAVTSATCSNDSDMTIDLTVNTPWIPFTTVDVSVDSIVEDVGGNDVPFATQSTTVTL